MSFQCLPPEVTSAQMYTGAGSGPLLSAAAGWDGLGSELGSAAASFSSVTSNLVSGAWQGAASQAMAAVAGQYGQWLGAASAHAGGAAAHARTIAGIFEAAKAAITHPLAVAANRVQLVNLVRSNVFGFNAPAIAATEGAYEGMWAQNVATLAGYHGAASAVAAQLAPWQQALQPLGGSAAQATPAASPAASSTLTQLFNSIAAGNKTYVQALQETTHDGIGGLGSVLNSGLTLAGTDLGSGHILKAAGDVVGTAIYGTGLLTQTTVLDLGYVGQAASVDLITTGVFLMNGISGF